MVRLQLSFWSLFWRLLRMLRQIFRTCRFPSTDLHRQRTTTGSNKQDGRRESLKHSTRSCKAAGQVSQQRVHYRIQADTSFNIPMQRHKNLTHYWLASNLMITPRSSPISSLVPGCNPPKAQQLVLAETGSLVPVLPYAKPAPHGNPSQRQDFPHILDHICFWFLHHRQYWLGGRLHCVCSAFPPQPGTPMALFLVPAAAAAPPLLTS